jgi:hypothetical protein
LIAATKGARGAGRSALAVVALAVLALGSIAAPPAARAASPSAASVSAVTLLFGFDGLLDAASERAVKDAKARGWSDETRACVRSGMRDEFAHVLDGIVATAIGSEENGRAWLAFSATPAGGKFVAFVREGVAAIGRGEPPPDSGAFKDRFTVSEMEAIGTFVQTPAGAAITKLSGLTISEAQKFAIASRVATACGLPAPDPAPTQGH